MQENNDAITIARVSDTDDDLPEDIEALKRMVLEHRRLLDTRAREIESLKLLIRILGTDPCLFWTERPGAGSKTDPRTGKWYDDVRPNIESIPWLTAEQRERIFHQNAKQVFTRFKQQ